MALGLASELARAFNAVLASQPRTAYATETLAPGRYGGHIGSRSGSQSRASVFAQE